MINRSMILGLFLGTALCLSGCGPSPMEVKGILKMDGQPVDGATVTYTSEDGLKSFSGMTDSEGNFSLTGPNKPGAMPGNYKVVIVKSQKMAGTENITPDSAEYKKQMTKMTKDMPKSGGVPQSGPALPGSTGGSGTSVKSELPSIYASVSTTPLTAKVPPDSQPVPIDIKSKP